MTGAAASVAHVASGSGGRVAYVVIREPAPGRQSGRLLGRDDGCPPVQET